MKNPHIILLDGKLWAFEPPEKPEFCSKFVGRTDGMGVLECAFPKELTCMCGKKWFEYHSAYSLALEKKLGVENPDILTAIHIRQMPDGEWRIKTPGSGWEGESLKENEPIKWDVTVEIVTQRLNKLDGSQGASRKVCRLIAPVKEENSAMSYTEGSDYTLSRESDEPGIQLNTNISTSPVPSENSTPRESETIEAWKAWEDDQRTNPTPVNPHAFAYGYNIAKNKYSQPVPSEQEKQEPKDIDFVMWYSGKSQDEITSAYKRYLKGNQS